MEHDSRSLLLEYCKTKILFLFKKESETHVNFSKDKGYEMDMCIVFFNGFFFRGN